MKALKRLLVNIVNQIKNNVLYVQNMDVLYTMMASKAEVNGIPLFLEDRLARFLAFDFITKDEVFFGAFALTGQNKIIASNTLMQFPPHVQHFVLAHEFSHLYLHHYEDTKPSIFKNLKMAQKRINDAKKGIVQNEELEADYMAASFLPVGQCIDALTWMMQRHTDVQHYQLELAARVEALAASQPRNFLQLNIVLAE